MIYKKYKLHLTLFLSIILISSCSYFMAESTINDGSKTIFKSDFSLVNKGKYATSIGELRVLVIFAAFKDDTSIVSESWKLNDVNLNWKDKIVNSSTELNFPEKNLTQYYYEMSLGKFYLYGDVYPKIIIPQKNQKEYKSISEVNHEILLSLDKEVDFSKYDNWSRNNEKQFVNIPDGQVDQIFIVYRNFEDRLFFNNGWTGIAQLYLNEDIITNDGVKITTGRLDKGSGIQSRGGKHGFEYMKYILAHEFGHFLLGAIHIENVTNLALMTGGPVWNASRGMNSWERYKLGWKDYIDIPLNKNSEIIMDDYITTGEAYRIKLKNNEWFVLENHQKVSSNDKAGGKGLYIYSVKNGEYNYPLINVQCADGNWNFKLDEKNQKLFKTYPNRLGKNEMNFIRNIKKKSYSCYEGVYVDNSAWGDEFDTFNLEYNNLFSPVSNPSSQNKSKIDFAVQVVESDGNKIKADIYFEDIYKNTPPSKPQILEIVEENNQQILKWLKNEEPDLVGYNVYIKNNINKLRTVFIPFNKIEFKISEFINSESPNIVWITAIDKDNRESVYSDYFASKIDNNTNNLFWIRKEVL